MEYCTFYIIKEGPSYQSPSRNGEQENHTSYAINQLQSDMEIPTTRGGKLTIYAGARRC